MANALQLPYRQGMPGTEVRVSRLLQPSSIVHSDCTPLPALAGECFFDVGKQARPHAFVFLLTMAAITVAREVGALLVGQALLAWFGVTPDPFILSVVLQLVVVPIGIGMTVHFSRAIPDSAARRHMLLTLLAATGIGLILTWLGCLVGDTNVRTWPLVLVYLLWAWAEAVSAA